MRLSFALVMPLVLAFPVRSEEATPTPPAEAAAQTGRTRLLVLDTAGSDLEKSQAETLTAFLASRAARFIPLEVISSADLRDLVALQAEKQSTGCTEDSTACLAEIAGALGAELVLSTRAGKLDAVYVVSLQLFDAKSATAVGRASVQAWSLAELPAKLGPALDEILRNATHTSPVDPLTASSSSKPPLLSPELKTPLLLGGAAGAGTGLLLAGAGITPALMYASSKGELAKATGGFTGEDAQIAAAQELRARALGQRDFYNGVGRWLVLSGVALAVVGGAALAVSFFLPETEGATP